MPAATPTPAAERQRRHRERRRHGVFVVPVQVSREMVEARTTSMWTALARPSWQRHAGPWI